MEPIAIKDIILILTICDERSFSRAAARCYISQPALSKIVKRVEERLGFRLFDRSTSPLSIPHEAEPMIRYFRQMYDLHLQMEQYSQSYRRRSTGINIAAPSFFCTYVLYSVIDAFRKEHPDVTVKLFETNDSDMQEFLLGGMVDIGLSVNTNMDPSLESETIRKENLVLAVPKSLPINQKLEYASISYGSLCSGNYLREESPVVSMSEFSEQDFLLLKEGNHSRDLSLQICRDAGFEPHIVMELDQLLTAYYLADAGKGLTITRVGIPYYAGYSDSLCFYRIDHPDMSRDLRVYYTRRDRLSADQRSFIEKLKAFPLIL